MSLETYYKRIHMHTQVYNFGKRNVFRLDLNESTEQKRRGNQQLREEPGG